jgi:DNA-binding NtrC family response regulator
LQAALVVVDSFLSDKKDKDDNDYRNQSNNDSILEKENSKNEDDNNDNGKPVAKLLIVDDDSDIVQVLKIGLQKNRFKSNAEAYCLVLSDVRMPGLSGIQLAKKVKEASPSVKVILMTSFEIRDSEFSKVFPSTHVDGFVQKPIGIKDLTKKILSVISETRRRKE